jgi:hypothetical protein
LGRWGTNDKRGLFDGADSRKGLDGMNGEDAQAAKEMEGCLSQKRGMMRQAEAIGTIIMRQSIGVVVECPS